MTRQEFEEAILKTRPGSEEEKAVYARLLAETKKIVEEKKGKKK